MSQSAKSINGLVNSFNSSIKQKLGSSIDKIKDGLDVLNAGKDVVSSVVNEITGEDITIKDIQQGASNFDTKWDEFANKVNEKFKNTSTSNQTKILEGFAKSNFGTDVYNLGSAVKNELPNVLEGVAIYKEALNSFSSKTSNAEVVANIIKNGVDKIVTATEKLSGSLNNAIKIFNGNNIQVLNTLSQIGSTSAVQNINRHLTIGILGTSISTSAKQFKNAIENGDIKGITDSMANGATTINNLLSQLNNTVPQFPNFQIPNQITDAIQQLKNGQAIYDAAGSILTSLIADASGHVTVEKLSNLFTHFNQNWDTFSDRIDTLFKITPANGQQAVLETLAQSMFGNNVYYAVGAIKRQLSGILGGISDIQDAIKQFGGSYRNPIEAANKIKNGVEKMIRAVEKIGDSINYIVKYYQGKGNITNGTGFPILDTLANLGDVKGIKALNTVIRIGGGGAAILENTRAVTQALKNKDIKGAVAAIKKAINDLKQFTKKGSYAVPDSNEKKTTSNTNAAQTATLWGGQRQNTFASATQSNSYVCSGATLKCTMGDKTARLTVLPMRTIDLTGQPMANISDHISIVNLAPFGKCRSLGYPATASATAAHHGHLTPMPCVHNTPSPWMPGKMDYFVKGQPALLKTSKCQCMWGGMISITDDGQKSTGNIDLSRISTQRFNTSQKEIAKSKDGIITDKIAKTLLYWNKGIGLTDSIKKASHDVDFKYSRNKDKFMDDNDADLTKSNPHYHDNYNYKINCATTTITFMLRKQGYNVTARARNANEHTDSIAKGLNLYKVWKNSDGTSVSPTMLLDEFNAIVKKKKLTKSLDDFKENKSEIKKIRNKINDPKTSYIEINELMQKEKELKENYNKQRSVFAPIYKEILTNACKEEGYYTFGLLWDSINNGGGHYTVIKSNKDNGGNIILTNIEPQTGEPFENIDTLINLLDFPPDITDTIMRTDNKVFNEDFNDLFDIIKNGNT